MTDLPRGVPFVDLLVPPGTGDVAADLQTRLDLVGGGDWRVRSDDGTMEESLVPMQPMRGAQDRIQIYGIQPFNPTEGLQPAVAIAMEAVTQTQAQVAAVGVYGVYAWGIVLVEDIGWLHGLVLLDWLYNPRIDDVGEILEDPDPAGAELLLRKKLAVFQKLWTPTRSMALAQRMPPGALQAVEQYQALTLLGPGGQFDPRYWQGFALQLAVDEVRALAQASGLAPAPPKTAPPATPAPAPAPAAVPPAAEPDDGLTPLARAQKEAERRATERAEAGVAEPEPAHDDIEGPAVAWRDGPVARVLWVPRERLEATFLRGVRDGGTDGLARSERLPGDGLERWVSSGAHFISEVPFLSRLFLDGAPLHKGTFEAASAEVDGVRVASCHLPRVAPVNACLLPPRGDAKRRIVICSDLDLSPSAVLALAGAQ